MKTILPLVLALVCIAGCSINSETAKKRYLDKGNSLLESGQISEAVINYRRAIQKDSTYAEAYLRLAQAEERMGNWTNAFQAFSRAADLMPDNPEPKVRAADLLLAAYLTDRTRPKALYDNVNAFADQLLAKDPHSVDGLRLKGQIAMSDRKYADAIDLLRQATSKNPFQPNVVMPLAQALIYLKQYSESEKLVLALLDQNKMFQPAYDFLYIQYMSTNRTADAEAILKRQIENFPTSPMHLTKLAKHYSEIGDTAQMRASLERLLADRQKYPDARLHVGEFYVSASKPSEALQHFEAGVEEDGKRKLIYMKRIVTILSSQGRRDEALQRVDQILKEHPDDRDSLVVRSVLWLDTNLPENIRSAMVQLEQLVQKYPRDADLRILFGRTLAAQSQLDRARSQIAEALRLRKDSDDACYLLAELSIQAQAYKEALQYVQQVLERKPDDARARFLRAVTWTSMKQYAEARSELNSLLRTYPGSTDAQLQLGLLNVAEGRYREAEAIFQRHYQSGTRDLRALTGMVENRVAQRQFDNAIELLQHEAAKNDTPALKAALASAAMRAGKYELALQQYEQLVKLKPQASDLYIRMGEVHQKRADFHRAIESFRKAKQLSPKDAAAAAYLGWCYDRTGEKQQAITHYREALQLLPDNGQLMNNLAYLIAEHGSIDEALQLAQRAVQRMPDNAGAADTLGWIYIKKGLPDSAIQIFSNLTTKEPNNPTYQHHFGAALAAKGDTMRAKDALKKALELSPPAEEAEKIRALMSRLG